MSDISIRVTGVAGRITLNRPKALNALSHDMGKQIDAALIAWADDPNIKLVILDAEGDKAFCAGGDVTDLYHAGTRGDYSAARNFWREEYQMNARIFAYPKPFVSFMQGFTMGGGVGIGCHGTHRIVCESSRISMPEVGIGLIPDVGGSLLLTLAPGRLGEYLALTAARMNAADAIHAGFADHFIPQDQWPDLIAQLERDGDLAQLDQAAQDPGKAPLAAIQDDVDALFDGETFGDILTVLKQADDNLATETLVRLEKHAPLSMACAVEIIHRLRNTQLSMEKSLDLEFRFTYRAQEHADFQEGVRALLIDKDRNPKWKHPDMQVPPVAVSQLLMPLGDAQLTFDS